MSPTTRILSATGLREGELAVREALEVLRAGGLVAFPTDTVYGLGALAFSDKAVARLYEAKGRALEKSIPVLLAGIDQLRQVAVGPPDEALRLARRFWPGALTIVVRRQPGLPKSVSATATVGVRVPDHPLARALLRAAGPMAVTSANRSGGPSLQTASQVHTELKDRVELILDGGRSQGGRPSTVVSCAGGSVELIREGPISMEMIQAALASDRTESPQGDSDRG